MGLAEKLMRVVTGARNLRRSRDPDSYAHYERDRDEAAKRADRARRSEEDSAKEAREKQQRNRDFETRYAAEHGEGDGPTDAGGA